MNWKRFRKPVAIIAALSLVIGLFPAYAVADNVDGGVGGAVAMDVENDKDVVNDKGAGSATEEQAPAAAEKDSVDGKKTPTASEVPQAKGAAKAAPQTRAGETVGLRIWTPGHGTIKVNDSDYGTECQGTWEEGAEVSIEAVPAEGYGFARWLIRQASGNPKLVYASSTKVVAGTDVEAAARFGLEKAPITVAQPVAGTSGSANPPSITVPTGAGYSVTESMWVGENSDLGSLALVTPNTFEAGKTYYMYVKLHDGDDSFASGGAGDVFETEIDVTGGTKMVQGSWSQQDGIVLESIIAVTATSTTPTHTVTFNTHGANTATPTQQEVEDGGYAAKPANPTKEGFSFLGWFPKEPSKLTRADFSGSNWGGFKFDQVPITGDITLHAAWYADLEGDMYDITDPDNPVRSQSYYYKGGAASWTSTYQCSSSPITQWYSYSTIQDSEVTMTAHPYDGYEFVCWALNAKPAANEILSTSATYTFTFDGEMTIYGLFQKATHTVSFDTGEGDTVQPQTVAHGGYATAPDRVKWGNYNTMGWHTAADPDTSFDFSNTPIMGDVVLYPNWVLSTSAHAMNKDANYSMGGGTVKRTSDSLVPAMPGGPGTTALTLSAPGSTVSFEAEAAEGFEFVGWTAGTSPTGAIISTEKTLSFTAESTSPTQLFAIFQEKTNPTLTVDCSINSGNVSDAISSVTVNGTALTLSEPDDGLIRPNPTVQGKVDIAPGEDVTVVIAPTDNYTVLGYSFTNISEYTGNMAPDGTTTITFKMPEENAGVSASLARAASVEYDANGGTPTLADWPADNMVKLPMSIAATGTPIDADYFSGMVTPPTGLVFAGLEVTHDSGTSTVDPGDTLSNAKFANGGKIKWLWGGGKTVTFDANGGGGTMDSAQVAEGAEYELPDCTFTAPNANTQAFDKWSVKIGDAAAVEKNPGDPITVSDDTVVTATWKDIVTVTFDPNGGTIDGSPDKVEQVIEKGGKATKPDNAVKEGFIEPDWYKDGTEFDLNTALYEDTELVARWYGRIKAWVYGVTEGKIYKGGHILATGYASPISEASLSIYEGEPMTLTAVPNDGYRFFGWAESKDGEVIETGFDFVVESYDGSVTRLVALFVKLANITYDVNGGTKGADWKDGEIVDVGTNLSKVLGDTVPDSVPENVAKAPEGKAFCGYRITTDADEQDLLNGEPIDIEITGATTVTYLWRDPTVTIHWSSMDDVDKMDPIVIEGVPVGSTVAEALAKIGGADRVDELFAKDGYKALGWLTSEPITKFSDYDALGGAEVKGSAVVEGDMDLYYGMLTEIDGTAEATIEVPVCGTEVTTPGGDRNKQTNAPQISTPDGVNYSPDTAKGYLPAWWMVSAAEPYTPFEGTIKGGQAYYAGIWLAADYGYVFASDNIAVDGAEVIEPWSELDGRFVGAAVSVEAEHEWGEWTVVKEATEEADGLEQRTCKHCDAAEEKAIPKIDVEYRCVAGDGSSLTFGSGETLSFIFKRNVNDEATFSHFTGISIDGTVLDKSNYTAKPGSVIVTLEPSFANTLSVGDHTIVAMFDDGNDAVAEFTVTSAEEKTEGKGASDGSSTSPKTGDTLPVGVVGLTSIVAAVALAFAWRKRGA